MKREVLFYSLLICSTFLVAQTTFLDRSGIRANIFTGYHFAANNVWKTKQSLDGNVIGLDIGLVQWGLKNEQFSRVYGNPRIGLDVRFIKMNNTDTFGYCFGILPTFEIEMMHQQKWSVHSKISFGINLNTMGYGLLSNFDNRAIVSPVNFAFDAGLLAHILLTPYLECNIGTGLYHVSNGSLKMPNGGINIVYLNTGITYYPKFQVHKNYLKPNYTLNENRFYYMAYGAFAYRQLGYFSDLKSFWVFSCVNQYMYRINKLYSSGIGLDGFYDATHALRQKDSLNLSDIPENKKYHLAIGLTNRFDIGKLFIPVGVYTYLYNNKYVQEPVYLRFGLGYQFHKHFFTGLFFKGTINRNFKLQSDFMEWSLGVRI
ncbi:MAG: acyloxyacyl hydrolase [Bacteroidota bacterium]|nr:acyloxyacyl hydrolase [Bacteroidota bacterium]